MYHCWGHDLPGTQLALVTTGLYNNNKVNETVNEHTGRTLRARLGDGRYCASVARSRLPVRLPNVLTPLHREHCKIRPAYIVSQWSFLTCGAFRVQTVITTIGVRRPDPRGVPTTLLSLSSDSHLKETKTQ